MSNSKIDEFKNSSILYIDDLSTIFQESDINDDKELTNETTNLLKLKLNLKDETKANKNDAPNENFKHRISNKTKLNRDFYSLKEKRPSNKNFDKRIIINVGGVRFETYKETLKLISESRLANLTKTNSDYDPVRNEFFFDRDPNSFQAILNYFRTGKLHAPLDVCGNLFYEELNFWGITERAIQPCCWTTYSTKRDCDEILKKMMEEVEDEYEYYTDTFEDRVPAFSNITNKDSVIKFPRENKKNWLIRALKTYYSRVRPSVWKFLDDRSSSTGATIFFWISVVFLVTSLVNFVLETSAYGRIPFEISTNKSLTRKERDSLTVPHPLTLKIELTCNIFFTIEYILRFISSPDKLKFIKNPYNFLEFLAILPLLWPTETVNNKNSWGVKIHNYVEVFYILRILRIFTLVPKYSGLRVLLITLKNSIGELMLYAVMLFMTIMIYASFVYYAEQIFEEEDNKFDSILIGLWWAIVTMTTLGYGDIVPVTPFGYFVGGLCALSGLIFMALPIPVIVNNFTTFYAHAKAREKLKEYSEIQKYLPNRAIAIHFISNDVKYDSKLNNSGSSLNQENELDYQQNKNELDNELIDENKLKNHHLMLDLNVTELNGSKNKLENRKNIGNDAKNDCNINHCCNKFDKHRRRNAFIKNN